LHSTNKPTTNRKGPFRYFRVIAHVLDVKGRWIQYIPLIEFAY
jgi:hypothetical protein